MMLEVLNPHLILPNSYRPKYFRYPVPLCYLCLLLGTYVLYS